MTISVIVPVYNIAPYLPTCINSITRQSFDDFELILVNDGSTDNCDAICESAARIDKRIKYLRLPSNKGLVAARKAGLSLAKSEFICYVDGDDWLETEYLQAMINDAYLYNTDVVIAGHQRDINGYREKAVNPIPGGRYCRKEIEEKILPFMLNTGTFSEFGIFSFTWGKLFRRTLLEKHQNSVSNDIQMGEDAACLYPLLLNCQSLFINNNSDYVYRQRPNSMLKSSDQKETQRIQKLYDYMSQSFGFTNLYNLSNQLLSYITSVAVVRCSPNVGPQSDDDLFLFDNIKKGDSVILVGAGNFGQHLRRKLIQSNTYKLLGITESHPERYHNFGLTVAPIHNAHNYRCDKFVVSYINGSIAQNKKQMLINMGIPDHKIATLNVHKFSQLDIVSKYGINPPRQLSFNM
jgi:glycosyltransferase involved in cell wall biosynthesis